LAAQRKAFPEACTGHFYGKARRPPATIARLSRNKIHKFKQQTTFSASNPRISKL